MNETENEIVLSALEKEDSLKWLIYCFLAAVSYTLAICTRESSNRNVSFHSAVKLMIKRNNEILAIDNNPKKVQWQIFLALYVFIFAEQ